ncbi:glycosyltransferase [Cellulomonas xiejunii]|uniref:Glycosyltransferase n=1 Tax=Cellulomonas xiejunii TaxID=2968083 RepID=A0ABY5KM38_9CELL|nr:glycosyltransferase [Cellulomonas xiejunii]MCC2320204.1 glycosyltransferase [Cellulomonas xiejunii]UUI70511.1 glycosyltransferase [Cellulomonas xiejunii]
MHVVVVSAALCAAQARSTVEDCVRVMPDATTVVLDLDGSYVPVGVEQVVTTRDLDVPDQAMHRLAATLSGAELVAAARPIALTALAGRRQPDEILLSVEAGVLLFAAPDALVAAAGRSGAALVVRSALPVPDDDRSPSAAQVLDAGTCSTAMVAVRVDRADVVATWSAATSPGGIGGRWVDALGGGATRVDDPALLLSAWSLEPGHSLTDGEPPALDGRPLVAVDLSRLDPDHPWLLDASLPGDPRGRLSDHPVLARIAAEQAARWAAQPTATASRLWDRTADGILLDPAMRRLLAAPGAPDPFDESRTSELISWLTVPTTDGGIGRYLRALHDRPDLRAAFPRVPGPDLPGFLSWARTHAVDEGSPPRVLEPALAAVRPRPVQPGRPAPGVNVVGFMRGELGIGESARLLVSALEAADVPYSTRTVDRHLLSRQRATHGADTAGTRYDTTVVCVNADLTPTVLASARDVVDGTYRIGMWYWEVEDFPESLHPSFAAVDEVWVASQFVREAIAAHSPVPVHVVPPPLPQRGPAPRLGRAELGLPDAPVVLFSFDYLSTMERKNPLGVIEAFRRAVPAGSGPVLVLKSINAHLRPLEAEQVRLAASDRPDVLLLEDYLSAEARDALVACCDVYMSLHRSEGLGLTIAEAMAWGKPVLATGYSGNLQFMTPANSYLVPWTPTQVPPGAEPYPQGTRWAEPDVDAAAALLRAVLDDPADAAHRGARAAADIAALHSATAAGRVVAGRLAQLRSTRRGRPRRYELAQARQRVAAIRAALG